ncbi:MAG: restriction endonuclease [Synergistaceae bacterium]|nr:restriction endonuclease [Synergistaceae bacterium]
MTTEELIAKLPPVLSFGREFLEVLADGKEHHNRDICDALAVKFQLTEEERNVKSEVGNVPVWDGRVSWTKAYLKHAGLLDSPHRGMSMITPAGSKMLSDGVKIDVAWLKGKWLPVAAPGGKIPLAGAGGTDEGTPQERIQAAAAEFNAALRDELLDSITQQSPAFFEELVVRLLVKMGYGGDFKDSAKVTGKSGDGGIDGIISEDKLGLSHIYIQAKRYDPKQSPIGSPTIKEFMGALAVKEQGAKGLFITTARFTPDAKKYAEDTHIVLIDGNRLAELMIEYDLGVATVETYTLKRVNSDFFPPE